MNCIHEIYGEIVTVRIGVRKFIVVSDIDAAREILQTKGHYFANRPGIFSHEIVMGNRQSSRS